jgi:hypothetical protein
MHEKSVECEKYASFPEVVLSDHKPVAALLKVPVRFWEPFFTSPSSPLRRTSPFPHFSPSLFLRAKILTHVLSRTMPQVYTVITDKRNEVQQQVIAERTFSSLIFFLLLF